MKYISPPVAGSHWNTRWAGTSLKIQKRVFYSIILTGGQVISGISAYKDEAADYGPQCIAYELKENTSSTLVKVGKWDCAYSAETFQEEGAWYTTHIWVTGERGIFLSNVLLPCPKEETSIRRKKSSGLCRSAKKV